MNNKSVKILDCTLRDGGYVNDWNFGADNIKSIISGLDLAGVDFIECGFMRDGADNSEKSLYARLENLTSIIPSGVARERLVAMIDYGEFAPANLPEKNENSIFGFRIIFKKKYLEEALDAACQIQAKGYNIFINPTFINQYTKEEFADVIARVNRINPYAFSIVDSMGVMDTRSAKEFFELADSRLNKNITLCFHSHNNLQLSFANALELINLKSGRSVIIDSSLFGMGRGAGNIKTEFLINYLNEHMKSHYKLLPALSLIHNIVNKFFERKPWGYSVPYYLAAQNFCHPNYASFLIEKKLEFDVIDKILKQIPESGKTCFDKKLIENLYNETVGVPAC